MKKNNFSIFISTIMIPALFVYSLIFYSEDEKAIKNIEDTNTKTVLKTEIKQPVEEKKVISEEIVTEEKPVEEININFSEEVAEPKIVQEEKINSEIPIQNDITYEVLNIINSIRANNGLTNLTMDNTLVEIASIRAKEITVNWSHTRPNGSEWHTIYAEYGIRGSSGENLAYGQDTAAEVVEDWMNSKTHQDNILNSQYNKTGIYVYEYEGTKYWVQEFLN